MLVSSILVMWPPRGKGDESPCCGKGNKTLSFEVGRVHYTHGNTKSQRTQTDQIYTGNYYFDNSHKEQNTWEKHTHTYAQHTLFLCNFLAQLPSVQRQTNSYATVTMKTTKRLEEKQKPTSSLFCLNVILSKRGSLVWRFRTPLGVPFIFFSKSIDFLFTIGQFLKADLFDERIISLSDLF